MMKSDAQLQRDVQEELMWDPSVGRAELGVACKNGVATLTGQVATYAQKYAAMRAAERVSGVSVVADELTVHVPLSFKRTDMEIGHAVAEALRWDIEVPDDKIKARVDEGWVWLDGDVEWEYQRSAAERAVRYLTGVKGVSNNIKISERPWIPDVKSRIESALKRTAELDAGQIKVDAAAGNVTLTGRVRSWAARQDAERAVWSAPGVTSVKDELTVSV
ncbi:MAG TPA: BON domain-containing protein [Gemmatimonadaceae bacterium]|jgi:osmotically-inducible protein OsmY